MEKQTTQELLLKIQELENKLKTLQKTKKYGLVFEEKPEIFEENSKNALPFLKEEKELEINNPPILSDIPLNKGELKGDSPTNIIIEGDNYHTLSCLKYTHKNKIDVIYIDPPYNTGNKDFIYNDNYVDKEDSYRHSKWLSFMKKRLFLALDLLSEKGVIFISIDDNEFAQLKLLCDEIFGEENFIANLIWKSKSGGANDSRFFAIDHEYIFCYGKNINNFILNQDTEGNVSTSYNLKDDKGFYGLERLDKQSIRYSKSLDFEILSLDGKSYYPKHKDINNPNATWRWGKKTIDERFNELVFKNGNIYTKNYKKDGTIPRSLLVDERFGRTRTGKTNLFSIFDSDIFSNPKSTNLLKYLLQISSQKNSIILDFFAGSGTTGHAVMELNRQDGGNRQFILCSNKEATTENPEKNICKNITYERNKKVILGYTNNKGEKIQGLGGKLKYYTTQFIKTESSIDDLRLKFINMCDDMLCIRENTFEKVDIEDLLSISKNKNIKNDFLKLYTNNSDFTVILYDVYYFDDLLKLVKTLNGKIKIYIFSIAKEIYEEELEIINNNIEIANIPDEILETYKKIFNF